MIKKIFKVLLTVIAILIILTILPSLYFYLKSNPSKLYAQIDKATKIIVTQQNINHKILFESTNIKDIQSFKNSLILAPKIEFGVVASRGELGISFYQDDIQIANIGYLTNNHINEFLIPDIGYVTITNKILLETWFKERNITMKKGLEY